MSLIRQIRLLLLLTLVLAFIGSVGLTIRSARNTLETQLQLKNNDNAGLLAHVLGQQRGDAGLMELVMSAQFDTGFYRSIRFIKIDGQEGYSQLGTAQPLAAPSWFVRMLPIRPRPGVAQVSDGWRALGAVEIVSQTAYAHDDLWQASLSSAAALGLLGLLMGLLSRFVVKRIDEPLCRAVDQADALVDGRFVTVPVPQVPELRRLTQAMNTMVKRVELMFAAQTRQLESLREQAHTDPLSGLSNRGHFMGQLIAGRQDDHAEPDAGLVLLRLLKLAEVNQALGRVDTDKVIKDVARTLLIRVDSIDRGYAGRLNGSDFALYLPVGGQALETASAMAEAMRNELAKFEGRVAVAVGAVEIEAQQDIGQILAAADDALARAESRGAFAVELARERRASARSVALLGEGAWRHHLSDALSHTRGRLARYPVIDPRLQLIHLECPLRLQLLPEGDFEPAMFWLPQALRGRLTSSIDEMAIRLAFDRIAADGQPICVNVSAASLLDSSFAPRLQGLVESRGQLARHLSLEVDERAGVDQFELLLEFSRRVRPYGIRFGLEHAGQRLSRIERLFEAGLDYIKLDAAVIHGIDGDATRANYLRSLVLMLHGISLQVIAEGVATESESAAAWQAGVDGQTGPWASSKRPDLVG